MANKRNSFTTSIKKHNQRKEKTQSNNFGKLFGELRNTKPPVHGSTIPDKIILERAIEAMSFKLEGWSLQDIHLYLEEHYKISQSTRNSVIIEMYNEIKRLASEHIETIVIDHYNKYEDLYQRAGEMNNAKLQLNILQAKEKLLGLIQDTPMLTVNNFFGNEDKEQEILDNILNFDNLSEKESNRLEQLLSKVFTKKQVIMLNP
jgi:hypothetical protein